jgi:polysaccharide deacetylase 2 family uncharacterized protein YibQ
LLALADHYWIVEVDRPAAASVSLNNLQPASGGAVEELLSDITFSELDYYKPDLIDSSIAPQKHSMFDTLKNKIPLFKDKKSALPLPTDLNSAESAKKKQIAIVIDDLGVDRKRSEKIVEMSNFKMTLAFLPYAENLTALIEEGRSHDHEIIVHMPMQPQSDTVDPGPRVLKVDMSAEQLAENLDKGLSAFDGFSGINNHMGSKFTSDYAGMDFLMRELKSRDLFFFDSVTSAKSKAEERAAHYGVTYLKRNVFLDHEMTDKFVSKALAKCARYAERHGLCIAIGHPKDVTINGLNKWVEKAKADGFEFVSLSEIIAQREQAQDNDALALRLVLAE